ncbi:hypothetical protein AGMMS49960_17670 [Betaproteobacteria bacterium]|nr:hypothetical protein AGMMS49543_03780 [Betaproteobacteria bacterium]GHU03383.1 hypothetical protein AGMMS49960_17670 [Betaproteobacteria bacterium]GHU17836.1 hypothetical protein AGMMS50243_06750 [Betaproteobacteria bacterium]
MNQQTNITDPVQAFRDVFGETPENVLSPTRQAIEVLEWLRAIFYAIDRLNDDDAIRHLANVGKYIADDCGNSIGCQHEEMAGKVKRLRLEQCQ